MRQALAERVLAAKCLAARPRQAHRWGGRQTRLELVSELLHARGEAEAAAHFERAARHLQERSWAQAFRATPLN
jgi:hypothetical protein